MAERSVDTHQRFPLGRISVFGLRVLVVLSLCALAGSLAATAMALLEQSRLGRALRFEAGVVSGSFMWSAMLVSVALWGAVLRELFPLAIRPDTATVEIGDAGIRNSGGPWLPWTHVKSLRPRRILSRLDIEGSRAETPVHLHYQSEGFALALQTILANLPAPPAKRAVTFSLTADRLTAVLACAAVGAGVWLTADFVMGALIFAIFPLGYWLDTRDKVKAIAIDSQILDVTFAHRRVVLQRADVETIELILGNAPRILLKTQDGGVTLQLPGSDAIDAYMMVADRWRIGARQA